MRILQRELNYQRANQLVPWASMELDPELVYVQAHLSSVTFKRTAEKPSAHPHTLSALMKCTDMPTTQIRKLRLLFKKTFDCTF